MPQVKSIRGITVEIAGNTQKLGEALKGVNAKSRDLASSLKYVDKLLDFDPGNTELLEEKQKLLTDAVGNTCDALEQLKDVQDQITEKYASGKIGQRAYLDFRAEVAKTEHQLRELYAESQKVERSLQGAGDEARDTAGDLDSLGGGAKNAAGELDGMDDMLAGLIKGGKIAAVTGLVAGAASKIGEIVEETQEYREEMAKLDIAYESANLSAEAAEAAYGKLYRVLGETDQSVEASQQIALLANNTKDVTRWASLAPGLIARMGDALQPETFYEGANETLKLNEATGAYVQLLEQTGVITVEDFNKQLQSLNSEEEKQQYMLEVTEQLLGDAALAYEERNADVLAARDADLKWQEAMGKVGETLQPLSTGFRNFSSEIVENLIPAVEDFVEVVDVSADWIAEKWDAFSQWAQEKSTEVSNGWSTAGKEISDSWDLAAENMELAAMGIYDPWIGAGATVQDVCQGMYASYDDAVQKIQKQKWTVPKPKVPEFSLTGKFALDPPSVPKLQVTWNAQGGIFAQPMVLPALDGSWQGFGEAGREAILPLDSFYSNLEDILTRRGAGGTQLVVDVNIEHFDNSSGQDPRDFANAVIDELNVRLQQRGAAFA